MKHARGRSTSPIERPTSSCRAEAASADDWPDLGRAGDRWAGGLFVGELALDGTVRPVRGVLPVAAYARARAVERLFVPRENASEAAVVGGPGAIVPVGHLREVIEALQGTAATGATARIEAP